MEHSAVPLCLQGPSVEKETFLHSEKLFLSINPPPISPFGLPQPACASLIKDAINMYE